MRNALLLLCCFLFGCAIGAAGLWAIWPAKSEPFRYYIGGVAQLAEQGTLMAKGHNRRDGVLAAGSSPAAATYSVSAYCLCRKCCGKSDGITASGVKVTGPYWRGYRVLAADRSIPFYATLNVEGLGLCVVLDRGSAIRGNRLDVLCASHRQARNFGRRELGVGK